MHVTPPQIRRFLFFLFLMRQVLHDQFYFTFSFLHFTFLYCFRFKLFDINHESKAHASSRFLYSANWTIWLSIPVVSSCSLRAGKPSKSVPSAHSCNLMRVFLKPEPHNLLLFFYVATIFMTFFDKCFRMVQGSLSTFGACLMDMQALELPSWLPSSFTASSEIAWEKSATCWRTPPVFLPSAWPRMAAHTRWRRRREPRRNQKTQTRLATQQYASTWRRLLAWRAWWWES